MRPCIILLLAHRRKLKHIHKSAKKTARQKESATGEPARTRRRATAGRPRVTAMPRTWQRARRRAIRQAPHHAKKEGRKGGTQSADQRLTIFYFKKIQSKKKTTRQTLQNCHATRRDKGFRCRHPSKQASNKNLVTKIAATRPATRPEKGFSPQTSPSLTRFTTRLRQGRDKAVRQGRDKAAATRQTLSATMVIF